MYPMRWIGPLATGILAWLGSAWSAQAACQLVQIAELQVTMVSQKPMIPVTLDGHAVQMAVDTGGATSIIWRSAAEKLGLHIQNSSATFYGAGGADTAGMVWIHDFTLAGATAHNIALLATGRGAPPGNAAGLLGEDFLSKFDVEFDLSSDKMRLFTPKNCAGDQVVYWAHTYNMVTLARPPGNTNWLEADISLNGRKAVAMFDSGSGITFITPQAMRRAGITPETPVLSEGATTGLAGKSIDVSVAVFPSLTIGQETIKNVRLRIADLFSKDTERKLGSYIPTQVVDQPDMLIGADYFLAHRIYVANSQGKMYLTYNGGPIFQTAASPYATSAPSSPESAPPADAASRDAGANSP